MIRIRLLNENIFFDYRESEKITQGIDIWEQVLSAPKDMTAFWIKQIVANHSTTRSVRFRVTASAPKSVVMQVIRATKDHPQPYVQSSRPDWTGKERSNDPYEEKLFIMDFTPAAFIEMAKQRLCNRTEDKTRKFVNEIVSQMKQDKDPFIRAIGYCSHPYCWWYKACPELKGCGKFTEKLSDLIIDDYKGAEDDVGL